MEKPGRLLEAGVFLSGPGTGVGDHDTTESLRSRSSCIRLFEVVGSGSASPSTDDALWLRERDV
jgi:hypothetical protein